MFFKKESAMKKFLKTSCLCGSDAYICGGYISISKGRCIKCRRKASFPMQICHRFICESSKKDIKSCPNKEKERNK